MKRIPAILLAATFCMWTAIFVLQKPVFLALYGGLSSCLAVMWHGLPLDMSVAGYLTAVPALVLLAESLPLGSQRSKGWLRKVAQAWFDVPCHRFEDKALNAFAYTDSCLGGFVRTLRQKGAWDKSLVIIVPDHLGAWPANADNFASWRFHIPMVWTGGAASRLFALRQKALPAVIDTLGSQQDIAATLLGLLGIDHSDMAFSKDMLAAGTPHYAYFMMNDGFGMITGDNQLIFDNRQRRVIVNRGSRPGANLLKGQALLQELFDDIAGL